MVSIQISMKVRQNDTTELKEIKWMRYLNQDQKNKIMSCTTLKNTKKSITY
jgi:hypothetical protein